ncbi:MAG: deoxyribose-phosphate aldolase [Cyclobacteriaceae bacterium]
MNKIKELANMIDHSLLHPTMTDEIMLKECAVAKKYDVASVCIKPYAVKMATEALKGSDVLVCTVVGFPQGNSTTEIKVAETIKACEDGATEIDVVVNIGKVLQEDWDYVKTELQEVLKATHKHNGILKVIFENDFLPEDKHKIKLCEICSELGVEFVKTSTGYGFVKGEDSKYSYQGATHDDLRLMRKYSAPEVQIKAAGGVRTLDELLVMRELGATRIGASATTTIMEEAMTRFGEGSDVEIPSTDDIGY